MALTEAEKKSIKDEVEHIQLVIGAIAGRKSRFERMFGFASNAAIVAVLGVAFTYFVGPALQRKYDEHKRRKQAAQDAFAELLNYAASPYEEYYASLPIATRSRITDKEFDDFQQKFAAIHLRRFIAYARLQGLVSVLTDRPAGAKASELVKDYAVSVRHFADQMDDWLNQLRCEPHCADITPPSELYERMHRTLHDLDEEVASKIILQAGEE